MENNLKLNGYLALEIGDFQFKKIGKILEFNGFKIDPSKVFSVIGKAGSVIKEIIEKFENLANEYNVGLVNRGIKKSSKTDNGFLRMLKKVKGKPHKLQYIPVKTLNPSGMDYWTYRISFIKSRLNQMKNFSVPLYYTHGKYKGLPTPQHLILILHLSF